MKNIYLPETNNDAIFTFIGSFDIIVYGVAIVALIALIVFIHKKRKGGKK